MLIPTFEKLSHNQAYWSPIPTVTYIRTIATFADDIAIPIVGNTNEKATYRVQVSVNQINVWTEKWKIKLLETECKIFGSFSRCQAELESSHQEGKPRYTI